MKRNSILVLAALVISTFFLSSYRMGAASQGWDCTGAETGLSNPAGCSNGGCHGNINAGITVVLELDSAGGIPVTKYKGGQTYTFKITGTNTTANSLPKFGFQVAAILDSVAQVTPVNAGAFQQTGLPTGVHFSAPIATYYVTNIVEQGTPLSPKSGTGGTGTVYQESFTWTAPATGTGTVSFWGVLNAVNFDGSASSADHWNTARLVVTEDTTTVHVSAINELNGNLEANVYPNPVTDEVQLELTNATLGLYNLNIFDTQGRVVLGQTVEVNGGFSKTTLNTSNWASGIYLVKLSNDAGQKVMKIVKR